MAKQIIVKNIVIGKPICDPWYMFCNEPDEWDTTKKDILFTEDRYLPRLMVNCGLVDSISEVRRNKPELMINLDKPDFLEVKWGKSRLYIQVGE